MFFQVGTIESGNFVLSSILCHENVRQVGRWCDNPQMYPWEGIVNKWMQLLYLGEAGVEWNLAQ